MLIDDAVTPLILSGMGGNRAQAETYVAAAGIAEALEPGRDYRVDRRRRDVELTEAGRGRVEELAAGLRGVWRGERRREELVLQEGQAVIVDESTGRTLPDRTWRAGLHQAIEAREALEVRPMRDTLARISFQRFFNRYEHLSGMSGTAREARAELWTTYRRPTVVLPTHRPGRRDVLPTVVTRTGAEKWARVVEEIERAHARGRPVLVGTPSIRESERLSELLSERDVEHRVLNARRHAEEASIIASAGQGGRVTVATNMAGRGTDIALGEGVADAGGLHVVATSFHESARVDRQLFGRGARQGDPGSARMIASLEDELLARFLGGLGALRGAVPRSLRPALFRIAQWRARGAARAQRRSVLDADERLDEALSFAGVEH